jgi:DNA-binding XRE family transcriptional regulator
MAKPRSNRQHYTLYRPHPEFQAQSFEAGVRIEEWQRKAKRGRHEMTAVLKLWTDDIVKQWGTAEMMKLVRERHGITQTTMAKMLLTENCRPMEIVRIENGTRKMTRSQACMLYMIACMLHLVDDQPKPMAPGDKEKGL